MSLSRFIQLAFLLLIEFSIGLSSTANGQNISINARRADFKAFCEKFQDNYAYIDRPEKPWKTWGDRYASAVDAAETPEAFAAVLEAALDELHDFHAEVRSRNPHRWLPVPTFADVWAKIQGQDAVIVAVRKGSDAERAGLVAGDRIIEIAGTPLISSISNRLIPAVNHNDPNAQEWALQSLLTGRADEERHFTIRKISGQTQNVELPVIRRFDRESGLLTVSVLSGNVGLIRFHNSLGDQKTVEAFDSALIELRSTRGLILDLRDVPSGGNSSVALGVMGRFVTQMVPYQRHRIPHYGQHDVERNWVELVSPRELFTYSAPVIVLVDHWTGSMGEGMAIGFDAMHRAVVVGTLMAHLAGAVSEFRLPETGVAFAIATEQLYHINGMPRQDWVPPILVIEAAGTSDDVILKRGLTELLRKR